MLAPPDDAPFSFARLCATLMDMARGGRRKRRKPEHQQGNDGDEPTHALGRVYAGGLGMLVGGGAGVVLAMEWLEDFELILPLGAGGAVVVGVLAAVVGDKVWETVVDWL